MSAVLAYAHPDLSQNTDGYFQMIPTSWMGVQ